MTEKWKCPDKYLFVCSKQRSCILTFEQPEKQACEYECLSRQDTIDVDSHHESS